MNPHPLARGARPQVRVAAEYVQTHADRPLSVAEIATAAGLHVRTLYRDFTRQYRLTPMQFVRQCRLARIRADLLTAGAGTTVTAVAMQHGVTHLGRFARDYARAFGEAPSATLQRARRPVGHGDAVDGTPPALRQH